MVIKRYNPGGCVGCPSDWGCLGEHCLQCQEIVMICDRCKEEVDKLYRDSNDIDLCDDCLAETFTSITWDNADEYITEF